MRRKLNWMFVALVVLTFGTAARADTITYVISYPPGTFAAQDGFGVPQGMDTVDGQIVAPGLGPLAPFGVGEGIASFSITIPPPASMLYSAEDVYLGVATTLNGQQTLPGVLIATPSYLELPFGSYAQLTGVDASGDRMFLRWDNQTWLQTPSYQGAVEQNGGASMQPPRTYITVFTTDWQVYTPLIDPTNGALIIAEVQRIPEPSSLSICGSVLPFLAGVVYLRRRRARTANSRS